MDITAVQEDWGFEFGWQALEAVADTARGLVGRRLHAAGAIGHGRRLAAAGGGPPARTAVRRIAQPQPRTGWRVSSTTGSIPGFRSSARARLAEALPGPLTPMTLDVQLSGLRTASRVMGQVLALGGVVDDEWGSRAIAVFGHRAYIGVSANVVAATQLPGWDQHAVARHALVDQPQVGRRPAVR